MKPSATMQQLIHDYNNSTGLANTFSVYNPAQSDQIVADISEHNRDSIQDCLDQTHLGFKTWSKLLPQARCQHLLDWAQLMEQHGDDLATLLSLEQGKPLAQAQGELSWGIDNVRANAYAARTSHGSSQPFAGEGCEGFVIHEPYGLVAAITPWNFPAGISMGNISGALAAGNSLVLKPAEDTPLTVTACVMLAYQAGIPHDALGLITTSQPKTAGELITQDPRVRLLCFTGSTQTGRTLYAQSAPTVKALHLELGGNAPFIVFDDADIEKAAADAAALKFCNGGQICININRFLIQQPVYDAFCQAFLKHAKAIRQGHGLDKNTDMGPLINQAAVNKVDALVRDAIQQGAQCLLGGQRPETGAYFYPPTVLSHMNTNMRMYREEIFGPVAAYYAFHHEEEVIHMANDTEYGLYAYFYTKDLARSWRVARALEAGTVAMNTSDSFANGPFGGYKQSGLGREGGVINRLSPYLESKTIAMRLD